jgi:hypothetical protein
MLAFQLSLFDNEVHKHVMSASNRYPNIQWMTLEAQFREFVIEPLKLSAASIHRPIVIVINVLDECGSDHLHQEELRQTFLTEFTTALVSLPSAVCIIITSQPEPDIANIFYNLNDIRIEELKISSDNEDIAIFTCERLKALPKSKVLEDWPGKSNVLKIVQTSDGYFGCADATCTFIEHAEPERALEDLVTRSASLLLRVMYSTVLETACKHYQSKTTFDLEGDCRTIFGLILAVKMPISPNVIDCFLKKENVESYELISQLGSVLPHESKEDPVHVLHDLFQDYLLSESGLNSPWYITIANHNQKLAERSIQLLDHTFGDKFCRQNLDQPRRREGLDKVTIYAASYWITHVREMDICPKGFQERLLQWL